jgi:hypothetical protein
LISSAKLNRLDPDADLREVPTRTANRPINRIKADRHLSEYPLDRFADT